MLFIVCLNFLCILIHVVPRNAYLEFSQQVFCNWSTTKCVAVHKINDEGYSEAPEV